MMDKNDANKSWGFIPDDLWQNILSKFAIQYANRIAFSRLEHAESIEPSEILQDWQPKHIVPCQLTFSWVNKLGQPLRQSHNLSLFEYTEELNDQLLNVPFSAWSVTSDTLPVDELLFFRDNKLLLHTIHYENWITFYGLTENQLKTLHAADKRISVNLYESNESEIEIECK